MSSKLDQLRSMTTVVADTGDIEAVRRLGQELRGHQEHEVALAQQGAHGTTESLHALIVPPHAGPWKTGPGSLCAVGQEFER